MAVNRFDTASQARVKVRGLRRGAVAPLDGVCSGQGEVIVDNSRANVLRDEIKAGLRFIDPSRPLKIERNGLIALPSAVVNGLRGMERNSAGSDRAFRINDAAGRTVALVGIASDTADLVVEPVGWPNYAPKVSVYCVDSRSGSVTKIGPVCEIVGGKARVEPHIYPRSVMVDSLNEYPFLCVRVTAWARASSRISTSK
jgi:hypothetical protein